MPALSLGIFTYNLFSILYLYLFFIYLGVYVFIVQKYCLTNYVINKFTQRSATLYIPIYI